MTDIAWALFLPACFALNMVPGPSNALALVHGTRMGPARAALAASGRLPVFAAMILAAALGLGALLEASAYAYQAIKLAGAALLIWVGWRILRAGATETQTAAPDMRRAFLREMATAAGNPKAIAIFIAFFPQFIDPAGPFVIQFAILGAAFLALEVVAAGLWALAGGLGRGLLSRDAAQVWLSRGLGSLLIASGAHLAITRDT